MLEFLLTILKYILEVLWDTVTVLFFFSFFLLVAWLLQYITRGMSRLWTEILGERSFLIISSPGVVIHELGHALFCLVFLHAITDIKFFTLSNDDTLGYVSHRYNPDSLYQSVGNFFIGIGPIILGVALISLFTGELGGSSFSTDVDSFESIWEVLGEAITGALSMFGSIFTPDFLFQPWSLLWLVAVILIGSHITLSEPDIEGASEGACCIVSLFLLYNLILIKFFPLSETVLSLFGESMASNLSYLLLIVLLLASLNLVIYLTRCAVRAYKFRHIPFKTAAGAIFLGNVGELRMKEQIIMKLLEIEEGEEEDIGNWYDYEEDEEDEVENQYDYEEDEDSETKTGCTPDNSGYTLTNVANDLVIRV